MRRTKFLIFTIGIVWEGLSLILPPPVAIPIVLIGLLMMAWAIWPIQIGRQISRLPAPVARSIFGGLTWLESKLDDTRTTFSVPSKTVTPSNLDDDWGSLGTFIKFYPGPVIDVDSYNILSLIDSGLGDFTVMFENPINPDTLIVHPIGDTPRSFRVAHVDKNSVQIIFDEEPDVVALRFDDQWHGANT